MVLLVISGTLINYRISILSREFVLFLKNKKINKNSLTIESVFTFDISLLDSSFNSIRLNLIIQRNKSSYDSQYESIGIFLWDDESINT